MKLNHILATTATALTMLAGAHAQAATVTLTSAPGVSDPSYTLDFDTTSLVSAGEYGVSAAGDYQVTSGFSGIAAAPLGGSKNFLAVPYADANGSATLSFDFGAQKVEELSLLWGSIDAYNSLDLLGVGGATFQTISGGSFPPHDGNQTSPSSAGYLNIALSPGETLTGLRLNSTSYALETDNYSFGLTSAAPEPSTWALMIAGVAMIGAAFRQARKSLAFAA